ncbi:MAG: DUF3795 domain-containing protein [Candidatus Marinimicrobia bacterium]|nr:DUF3795 domain-containing protein [Candidatus Neomarinimicrobiota bacterium]
MNALSIAPCGMNCSLCIGFIREKNRCEGCNGNDQSKPQYCRTCTIVVCEKRKATESGFCYDCPTYPCARIKQIDKRYRTKHGMSMFENLAFIKENGIDAFLKHEEERWKCKSCGVLLSVHRKECMKCGEPRKDHPLI